MPINRNYGIMYNAHKLINEAQNIKHDIEYAELEKKTSTICSPFGLRRARIPSVEDAIREHFEQKNAASTIVSLLQITDEQAQPCAQKYVQELYKLNPPLEAQVAKLLPEEQAQVAIR